MIIAILSALSAINLFGSSMNGHSAYADPDCSRYLDAMNRPAVIDVLKGWYNRLPKVFNKENYPRILESSGFGAYSIALDFDRHILDLGPAAHAEISVDPRNNRIRFAAITDAKSTGFVFIFKDYEYMFEGSAMDSPRISGIGVACAATRDGD